MIKKIVLVFVLLLLPSIGFADEYVLVMSKEDNVCQHMLKLYNEDLRKYGEVKYDEHKEFQAIKWEKKRYFQMLEGEKDYLGALISRFDINNNGKEEIVVIGETYLRSISFDTLYFFKKEDSGYFKDDFDVKIFDKAIGKVGMGGAGFMSNFYDLKELPQFLYIGVGDKEAKAHYSLAGYFYIKPFIFKGTYYIDMKDEDPLRFEDTSEPKKWLVVLKYTKDNQPKDICYYLKVSDCNNKN